MCGRHVLNVTDNDRPLTEVLNVQNRPQGDGGDSPQTGDLTKQEIRSSKVDVINLLARASDPQK
jgi:hypothetical protein